MQSQEQFKSSIKILLIAAQIFGACPINLSSKNTVTTISAWIHYIWFLILITIVAITMYFYYFDLILIANLLVTQRVLALVEYLCNLVNCSIIMIGCNYQRLVYENYFQRIDEIDLKLVHGGSSKKSNLKWFLIKMCIPCGIILLIDSGIIVIYQQYQLLPISKVLTIYIVPNVIILLALLEYFSLLYFIQQSYTRIADALKAIIIKVNLSYRQQNNQSPVTEKESIKSEFNAINLLKQVHYMVGALEENTCESFGILSITLISSTFIIVTGQLFYFYASSYDGGTLLNFLYSTSWIILHIGKVYAILHLNSKVLAEVNF